MWLAFASPIRGRRFAGGARMDFGASRRVFLYYVSDRAWRRVLTAHDYDI